MIVVLVLAFFLALGGLVLNALESSSSAERAVREVYIKQQSYHVLTSVLPYILSALRSEDASVDTLQDPWAFPFVVETEKGRLEVVVSDEDRFFNLSTVAEGSVQKEVFERLLELLKISPGYSERLLAWMGRKPQNFETEFPLKGAPLDSPYELKYLGMGDEDLYGRKEGEISYPGLLSLVTTTSSGKVNVNTAPKYVLMALDKRIDASLAERIIEHRSSKPFNRVEDLVLVEGFTFDILYRIREAIDVKSTTFRIRATVRSGEVESTLEVVYDRVKNEILYKRIY